MVTSFTLPVQVDCITALHDRLIRILTPGEQTTWAAIK